MNGRQPAQPSLVTPLEQFVYASVPRLPGRPGGGWGTVVRTCPEETVEEFRGWVSTRLSGHPVLPQFPEAADLARRPVRLRAGTQPAPRSDRGEQPELTVLAHSIDAGPDATRRPGNVCSHVAVVTADRLPRPIEVWGSPDWLRPFQPEQTAAVTLPQALRPGPLEAGYTFSWAAFGEGAISLGWILAAAEYALATRRALLLATRSPDEAAHWIAVITQLSPRLFPLPFSTLEDAFSLDSALGLGLRILGVDAAALPAGIAERQDLLVVDPTWQVQAPDGADGAWRLPGGQHLPAGPWAELALELLNSEPAARMAEADDLAELIGAVAVAAAPLYWTSAAALLRTSPEDLFEPTTLLRQVLLDAPDGVPEKVLDELLDMLASADDQPSAAAWRGLAQARSGQVRVAAVSRLVESSLAADDVRSAPRIRPADRSAVAALLRAEIADAVAAGSPAVRDYLWDNGLIHPAPASQPVVQQGFTPMQLDTGPVLAEVGPLPEIRLEDLPGLPGPVRPTADDPTTALPTVSMDSVSMDRGSMDSGSMDRVSMDRVSMDSVTIEPPVVSMDKSMDKEPDRHPADPPAPGLSRAEQDLLAQIRAQAEVDPGAAGLLAEAALRLAGLLGDGGLATPAPARYLPFIGYFLIGEARRSAVSPGWVRYAARIWERSGQSVPREPLLIEIGVAVLRQPALAAALSTELAAELAARFPPPPAPSARASGGGPGTRGGPPL